MSTLTHAWGVASELRLRLLVANVSCRFVIGAAQLETPLNRKEAWNMMGNGLAEARDKLNDKRTGSAYRFSLPGETIVEPLLDAVGDSLTEVERGWTPTQLEYYSVRPRWVSHERRDRKKLRCHASLLIQGIARGTRGVPQAAIRRAPARIDGIGRALRAAMIIAANRRLRRTARVADLWRQCGMQVRILRWSATTAPPESGQKITLRAGRVIGILERVLIFVGLVGRAPGDPGWRRRFEDRGAVQRPRQAGQG